MRRAEYVLIVAVLGLFSQIVYSQAVRTGPQVLTFFSDIDDSDQPYAFYLPKNYNPATKYPLVISLHGEGSNHRLNLRRVFGRGNRFGETEAEATRNFPVLPDVDFLVASPLVRGSLGYRGIAEKDVYAVLDDVKRRFAVDENRIYLTGLSMGGGGALWLGLTRPDVWAAVAAVCPDIPPNIDALAGNAALLPVKLFHGALDPLIPVAKTRLLQKTLLEKSVPSEYVEYPAVRHNAWDTAYRNAEIFRWFESRRRIAHPAHVKFTAFDFAHGSAYWVRFDNLTPGTPAEIDAQISTGNRIEIRTKNLGGFTLSLKGHPQIAPTRPLRLSIDGKTMSTPFKPAVEITQTPKGWALRKPNAAKVQLAKKLGSEGPVFQAVSGRHVYVYGSLAAESEELLRRQERAKFAANWSTARSRVMLNLRVISDLEVSRADRESANLVLFGTKETNSILAELAPRLPLALKPGAADYGLLFIYPVGGQYVLVSSGLPWWTRLDQTTRSRSTWTSDPYTALESFGDYLVFKGGLDNIVAEGRFDTTWKLKPEDAAKLSSTGAFEIRSESR